MWKGKIQALISIQVIWTNLFMLLIITGVMDNIESCHWQSF